MADCTEAIVMSGPDRKPVNLQKRDLRWLKEGRGQGRREEYKRWLNIQDLARIGGGRGERSQQGTFMRPCGRVVARDYHFASYLESRVFDFWDNLDIAPWGIEVLDILEQVPLLATEGCNEEPARDTLAIARALGIQHIPAERPDSPTVMTTDLIVKAIFPGRTQPIVIALAIKPSSALSDSRRNRTLEKLEIEMLYWQQHTFDALPVQWFIVTEKQVPEELVTNLRHLGPFKSPACLQLSSPADLGVIRRTCLQASVPSLSLSRFARQLDQQLRLPLGSTINAIYHLIANQDLEIDLFQPLLPEKPLDLQCTALPPELEIV